MRDEIEQLVPQAAETLARLMKPGQADPRVQLDAAQMILNSVLYPPPISVAAALEDE